jgi:hypothetical protein
MGLDGPSETLQQIADDYNITRERIRQLEARSVKKLIQEEYWDDLLSRKLLLLLQDRDAPLPVMGIEGADPWFVGISNYPEALKYLLDNLCEGDISVLSIDGVDYFSRLSQDEWAETLAEAGRLLEGATKEKWSEERCRSLVAGLLPERACEFRDLLWEDASRLCHFSDTEDGRTLTSYGRGVEQLVEAVLHSADRPHHFSEIASLAAARAGRDVDIRRAHNAAATVGLLMGRGVYGVERHLPLNADQMLALGIGAENIVHLGPDGRQWHTSEILEALQEQGIPEAAVADKYVLDIALRRSGHLARLGRLIWASGVSSGHAEVHRIEVRQAITVLLQDAGGPLRTNEIWQQLTTIRGINSFFQIPPVDPIIRIGSSLWGLNDRDLIVKRAEQPQLIADLFAALNRRQSAIHVSEVQDVMQGFLSKPSAIEIFSLAVADERFRVNPSQYLYLAEWGGPRRESIVEAVESVLSAASGPLSFEEILPLVEARIHRPCDRNAVSTSLQSLEAVLNPVTGLWVSADAFDLSPEIELGSLTSAE